MTWFVYVKDAPGNPWGPFDTKRAARDFTASLKRNHPAMARGTFTVSKVQGQEQATRKVYK
jgi:hypothetical protein